ncbi:MAG: nucleotide exchange factor GrpE [Candidatus Sumerlaeia bacterium]|nr:nucleotide exchange factor GrpE [Candidatus Sumerlaeia bacterium]
MDLPKPKTRIIAPTRVTPPVSSNPPSPEPKTPLPPEPTPIPVAPSAVPAPAGHKSLRRRKKYALRRRIYCAAPPPAEVAEPTLVPVEGEPSPELLAAKEALEKERDDLKDQVLRARADLDNQRRRHAKERDDVRKYAAEDLLHSLIPALDHFALALQSVETATDLASVSQGIRMIHRELLGTLQSNGLAEIHPAGEPFDPQHHEAVATAWDESKDDGVVLETLRPGWMLRDRVLRAAMVKVNKRESSSPPPEG